MFTKTLRIFIQMKMFSVIGFFLKTYRTISLFVNRIGGWLDLQHVSCLIMLYLGFAIATTPPVALTAALTAIHLESNTL